MKKAMFWTGTVIEHVIMILLIVLVSLTFVQVIFRYVLGSPLVWSEEVIRYSLIWIVLLGAGLGLKDDAHIGVEYFLELLPEKAREGFLFLNILLISAVAVFLAVVGGRFALNARGSTSPAMGIPNILIFCAIPVSAVTWLIFLIGKLSEILVRSLHKEST